MPVDSAFTDSFSSSFLENGNNSFSLDKISSPAQMNAPADRKRKYFGDDDPDISSSLSGRKFLCYPDPDLKPDDETDFLKMASEFKGSTSRDLVDNTDDKKNSYCRVFYNFLNETDQKKVTSPKKQSAHPLAEDNRAVPNDTGSRAVPNDSGSRAVPIDTGSRAIPNDAGSRAVPNDRPTGSRAVPNDTGSRAVPYDSGSRPVTSATRSTEELASILNNLPSRDGMMNDHETGAHATELESRNDASSYALLPMKNLVENVAQQIRDGIVQDWSQVFSKMEYFEIANLEQLDQILASALAYEAKLKGEKAELRNFLMKLSDVFQHD